METARTIMGFFILLGIPILLLLSLTMDDITLAMCKLINKLKGE